MAQAIAAGVLCAGRGSPPTPGGLPPSAIYACNRSAGGRDAMAALGVPADHLHASAAAMMADLAASPAAAGATDVVVLAVKPPAVAGVLAEVGPHWTPACLLLSVAAGVGTGALAGHLAAATAADGASVADGGTPPPPPPPSPPRVVRAMPNVAAAVRASTTTLSAGAGTPPPTRRPPPPSSPPLAPSRCCPRRCKTRPRRSPAPPRAGPPSGSRRSPTRGWRRGSPATRRRAWRWGGWGGPPRSSPPRAPTTRRWCGTGWRARGGSPLGGPRVGAGGGARGCRRRGCGRGGQVAGVGGGLKRGGGGGGGGGGGWRPLAARGVAAWPAWLLGGRSGRGDVLAQRPPSCSALVIGLRAAAGRVRVRVRRASPFAP
ncbi:hypothetical protein BU14_0371s0023 [Porphyra umbilicalis]|uniref:Uncharacterized protein n=1 Tax=Porphyra umbilicalis TaxID=2786 RepID=A0A1X6NXE0_PORUM|nr:hypothetical protein BU14_0371s0023 [Porphyra umbilicalis]|eukprot:OSX73190.1 hypothetical protein BU14_0371s0023 [Porphyra umbilicalis]